MAAGVSALAWGRRHAATEDTRSYYRTLSPVGISRKGRRGRSTDANRVKIPFTKLGR